MLGGVYEREGGYRMTTGELIRARRIELGMSQTELAIRAGCKQQEISRYEYGLSEPKVSRLVDIATGLGIDIRELLDGK